MFPVFKGDSLPLKRKRRRTGGERNCQFKPLTKSQFIEWCSTNSIESGSEEWVKSFNQWRNAVTE